MLSSVLKTAREHELFASGDRVLVAVSGGADSMALLHVLWEAAARLGITLEAATVDHGLRPEARAEAELVAARAAALEVPWHRVEVDVGALRRSRGGSLQDVARQARLAALGELATRRGARRIALGHQADDQAETVLFRIVRGTGIVGLRGIPYRRDPLVRPLLDVGRAEVLRYLRRRSIPFAEDPSNADLRFARARVRHRLLPLLREENPRVRDALVALAASARGAEAGGGGGTGRDLGVAFGRRAAEVIARLAAERGGTRRVDVRGGRVVEVAYGEVSLRPPTSSARLAPEPAAAAAEPVAIPGPGVYAPPGAGAVIVSAGGASDGDSAGGAVSFDADALAWPLAVRARRAGDRMRPRGSRGSRKLSDLLIDAKISRNLRARLPVVTTADGVVLFVPGLRPAERGRPTKETTHLIKIAVLESAEGSHLRRKSV